MKKTEYPAAAMLENGYYIELEPTSSADVFGKIKRLLDDDPIAFCFISSASDHIAGERWSFWPRHRMSDLRANDHVDSSARTNFQGFVDWVQEQLKDEGLGTA